MIKKISITILILIVLSSIALVIFFFILSDQSKENILEKVNFFPIQPVDTSGVSDNDRLVPFIIEGEDNINESGKPSLIRKISNGPIAGYTIFKREVEVLEEGNASTTPLVTLVDKMFIRYIDRSIGNIFEAKEEELGLSRITNTTIPKLQEALLDKNGESSLLRYLSNSNNVQTLAASIVDKDGEEEKELKGDFIQQDILSIVSNPDKTKVFYIIEGNNGGALGYISSYSGSDQELVFNSPLKDWNTDWPTENTITLTTKPHSSEPGLMFSLNAQSGNLTKLLGGINGLTGKLSPEGNHLLYSESDGNSIKLFVKDMEDNSIKRLTVQTLPEKCVWSNLNTTSLYCSISEILPKTSYPESWYLGNLFFNDSLWKIDVDLLSYTLLMSDRERVERSFDMHEMTLTDEDEFLYFRNKQDLELWSINIKEF